MAVFLGTAAPKKPLNRNNGLRVFGQCCQSQGHVPNISQQPLHRPSPQRPTPNPLKVPCRQKRREKKNYRAKEGEGQKAKAAVLTSLTQLKFI